MPGLDSGWSGWPLLLRPPDLLGPYWQGTNWKSAKTRKAKKIKVWDILEFGFSLNKKAEERG